MRTEAFSFDLGDRWRDRATNVVLVIGEIYYPEKDIIVVHVFFNQPSADSTTPIEGNPNFTFRFVLRPRPRFTGNARQGLLPWTPPGATGEDPPFSFEQNITQYLRRLGIEGGKLNVTFVPYDPEGLLRGAALELKGGISLKFI